MQLLASVLYWLLTAYFWVFVGRFILDLVLSVNRAFRPRGLILVMAELIMTLTDPPLKLARRFLKPIRLGSLTFDFAWTACIIAITFLIRLAHFFS